MEAAVTFVTARPIRPLTMLSQKSIRLGAQAAIRPFVTAIP